MDGPKVRNNTWAKPLIKHIECCCQLSHLNFVFQKSVGISLLSTFLCRTALKFRLHFSPPTVSVLYSNILYNHFYLIATYCTCSTYVLSFWMSCICEERKNQQKLIKKWRILSLNLSSLPQKDCLYTEQC